MRRIWQTNLPLNLQGARARGSGMTLPMPCHCCSTRMKGSRRSCRRDVESPRPWYDTSRSGVSSVGSWESCWRHGRRQLSHDCMRPSGCCFALLLARIGQSSHGWRNPKFPSPFTASPCSQPPPSSTQAKGFSIYFSMFPASSNTLVDTQTSGLKPALFHYPNIRLRFIRTEMDTIRGDGVSERLATLDELFELLRKTPDRQVAGGTSV